MKPAWPPSLAADTAPMVFSAATKGVASTVIHRLADRGLIDDTPVADYWPEFGANGKAGITVRDVMRHRAGPVPPGWRP